MTTKPKVNMLKNMDINEISLVVAGMNQGADVILTKARQADWRAAINGDVEVGKAFDAQEPRDKTGKWTSAEVGAIGGKQGSYRRQVAQAFAEKAKAIAHATVGHTISAIKTTRPTGLHAVHGGGVQFSFQHRLQPKEGEEKGALVNSKVQIRPEHLGRTRDVADFAHVIAGKNAPRSLPNKAQRALYSLHRVVHKLSGNEMVEPFAGPKALFARAEIDPSTAVKIASGVLGSGSSSSAPTPVSTAAPSSGLNWQPNFAPPDWVGEASAKRPIGYGRRTDPSDSESPLIPLSGGDAHARASGGHPYYTKEGHFIIGARPDIQEHLERAHQDLARIGTDKPGYIRNRTHSASEGITEDKGYFTHSGDYIPPTGRPADNGQRFNRRVQYETAYKRERERKATIQNLHGGEPPERAAAKLFGPQSPGGGLPQEYDLGSSEQRRAAADAARQDMTRKSLFSYPESMVKRLPPGPYHPALFWHLGNGTPGFASRDAGEPVIKRARKLNFNA